jgi:hypothetical protein
MFHFPSPASSTSAASYQRLGPCADLTTAKFDHPGHSRQPLVVVIRAQVHLCPADAGSNAGAEDGRELE